MSCDIKVTPDFIRAMKRLAKRYRSFADDLKKLNTSLSENPRQGVDLGNNIRKVRMAISSKGKGKSGGTRVITYGVVVAETDTELLLLTIYDKSERENISDGELKAILSANGLI